MDEVEAGGWKLERRSALSRVLMNRTNRKTDWRIAWMEFCHFIMAAEVL